MWSICLLLLASGAAPCTANKQKRIIGGSSATSAEFPYMGSLQKLINGEWEHICGCVAFTTTKAVTVAHCLGDESPSAYRMVFGTIDITTLESTAQISALTSFTKHPSFTSSVGFTSDVAVLRLASALDTSVANVGTISLAAGSPNFTSSDCTVVGWGALSSGILPDVLQKKTVTVTSQGVCDAAWSVRGVTIGNDLICAGEGFSERDSGGPLACSGTLAGLVSFGGTCTNMVLPNVFTSISFFNTWIQGQ